MWRPRSRLGLAFLVVFALAGIVLVTAGLIWNSGRLRLDRALVALRESGGPELPPQTPEITEGGKKTAAWFAPYRDDEAWARGDLETAAAIDALQGGLATELKVLADALRVSDAEVAEKARELERDREQDRMLAEMLGTELPEARSSLEYERASDLRRRVDDLLEKQSQLETWDSVARAWIRSRTLAHPEVLARVDELLALDAFDPPAKRGAERLDLSYQRGVIEVQQVLLEALPQLALAEDRAPFVKAALASLALGRLRARCWGFGILKMDAWARLRASWAIRACLQFLPSDVDLRALENTLAADRPRIEGLEDLRRERAVGNEIFVEFRAGTVEAGQVLDGKNLFERELIRLWISHEQAGYLEMLTRAMALAERAPFELPGGLQALDEIAAHLRDARPWQLIRSMITPNFRGGAIATARLEAEQQLTLLCFAAWRDPASLPARLAATEDPFTGKPLRMRDEGGVLVFWSVGENLQDDGPEADDIVGRFRPR